jgi:hypothetical protein
VAAYAASSVKQRNASFSDIAWFGYQPAIGWPDASWRVTAAWMPKNGFGDSTGKSEPQAMREPWCRKLRQA